jgi:hypothetical protein
MSTIVDVQAIPQIDATCPYIAAQLRQVITSCACRWRAC